MTLPQSDGRTTTDRARVLATQRGPTGQVPRRTPLRAAQVNILATQVATYIGG
jgi:hypothetical protein